VVGARQRPPRVFEAPAEIARPAPHREDRSVDLDLRARHLARDVLDLLVVGEQELGRRRRLLAPPPPPRPPPPSPLHHPPPRPTANRVNHRPGDKLTSVATPSRGYLASPNVNSDPLARLK